MAIISDLFIQNTAGIPYLSKCYGGDYCINNPNHTLITGFFAAINSFKGEFNQNELKYIGFENLELRFYGDDQILVIAGVETKDKIESVNILLKEIFDKFKSMYSKKLNKSLTMNFSTKEFEEWIDEKIGKNSKNLNKVIEDAMKASEWWDNVKELLEDHYE